MSRTGTSTQTNDEFCLRSQDLMETDCSLACIHLLDFRLPFNADFCRVHNKQVSRYVHVQMFAARGHSVQRALAASLRESQRAGRPKTRVLFCWRWLPYACNRGRTESARYLGLKAHTHSAVHRATDAGAARQRMETA